MTTILLVGCGNMGFAMMRGWLSAPDAPSVYVVEPNSVLAKRAADAGAIAVGDAGALPEGIEPDLVMLAVKPQMMASVAPGYARFDDATMVSVAAGTRMDALSSWTARPVIRCMPNTPAAVGKGMLVCCATEDVSEDAKDLTTALLSYSGEVAWIEDEGLMDAVTAISGSGPAYVFHMIECLAAAGEALDLPPEIAAKLAMQTVLGAGAYASVSETPPDQLRVQVTSPGGTTAAALDVLMGNGAMSEMLRRATKAARDRGRELGQS